MLRGFEQRRLALEKTFFDKRERAVAERYEQLRLLTITRQTLAEVSGITDEGLLDKLVELDVRPETIESIAIVPLVFVAWADGFVDPKEHDAVIRAAHSGPMASIKIDMQLLDQWLTHKPDPALMDAWRDYVQALCSALAPEQRTELKMELIGHARSIAAVAGGFLGLTSPISSTEEAVLKRLESAFDAQA